MKRRHRPGSISVRVRAAALAGCIIVAAAAAGRAQGARQDLKRLSLEELLQVPVETVARQPEPTSDVAAAIYVITGDDIRRSGARSIPEALRLAPGVQVARIGAGTWSIGVRGFADRLARSMLVLIDGRAVYSPLFAGTYWEVQDTLLEDVDRIEVIRGPGGTLWGANAVNGIINIITKTADRTAGLYAFGGGGSSERAFAGLRYGATTPGGWSVRGYAKAVDRAAQFHPDGLTFDGMHLTQGGVRLDRGTGPSAAFTVQGDVYAAALGERPTVTTFVSPFATTTTIDAPLSGANVMTRWSGISGGSTFRVQGFYARTSRDERPVAETRDTFDLDFQHALPRAMGHQLVWGAGYRISSGRITAIAPTRFMPDDRTDHLASAFAQDDVAILDGRLRFTGGAKIEHNDYSGVELQPSGRVAWTMSSRTTLWGAVTRAVRTPSRVETDYTTISLLNPSVPQFVRLEPNPGFSPEELAAYETGLRLQPGARSYVTISGFYNRHDNVLSTEILPQITEPAASPERAVVPVMFANGLRGESYGTEITGDVRPVEWWRVTANYSFARILLEKKPGSRDGSQERRNEGMSPRHQVQLQTSFDLPRAWSVDVFGRYVSDLRFSHIPAYATTNVRVAWQATQQLEIAAVGQDLNHANHVEWPSGSGANIGIRRSGYVALTWRTR